MTLLFLILSILLIKNIDSLESIKPRCDNCKWFISNTLRKDLGFCKIFSNKIIQNNKEKIIYNYSSHCRDNEFLCGKNGWLFEAIAYDKPIEYINLMSFNEIEQIEKNTQDLILNQFDHQIINHDNIDSNYVKNFNKDEKKYYDYYIKHITKKNKPTKKYL
jgi:hypothetical protein